MLAPSASTLWLLRALGLHALQVGVDGPVDRRHHVPARPELPSGRGEHFSGGRHLRMRHTTRCAKPFASLMATVPFVFPTVCFVAVGIAVRSSTGGRRIKMPPGPHTTLADQIIGSETSPRYCTNVSAAEDRTAEIPPLQSEESPAFCIGCVERGVLMLVLPYILFFVVLLH